MQTPVWTNETLSGTTTPTKNKVDSDTNYTNNLEVAVLEPLDSLPEEIESQSRAEFPSSNTAETEDHEEHHPQDYSDNSIAQSDIFPITCTKHDLSGEMETDNSAVPEEIEVIPASERHVIPDFDWDEFNARFEDAMAKAQIKENELRDEFQNLAEYFKVWCEASAAHDQERISKRLRTRIAFVQQSQSALDAKREKYIKIVGAFEHAFNLFMED